MIHDDCNMAEEVNFQQATRAICCINLMNTIVIFLIKIKTNIHYFLWMILLLDF